MSSSSNEVLAQQRNTHHNSNTMKRRFDRGFSNSTAGDFHQERNRYAPYQKRDRSDVIHSNSINVIHSNSINNNSFPCALHNNYQKPFVAYANPNPQLVPSSNLSRVCNYGDTMIHSNSNSSSNSFPCTLRNSYQKPFVNPNPQLVPLPLPYRKLDDFDSLSPNLPVIPSNCVPRVRFNPQPNYPNSMPPPMNHLLVSQAMPQQPIMTKEKPNSTHTHEPSLSFDSVRRESVIRALYFDIPRQCSSCGIRFKSQEDHSTHMDWHVKKNRIAKQANRTNARLSHKSKQSRSWLAISSLWLSAAISGTTKPTFEATLKAKEEELAQQQKQNVVSADENQTKCALCEEPFENFFSDEADDWLYKDSVYLHELGPIVHVKCMPEPRKRPSKGSKIMSVTSALVC